MPILYCYNVPKKCQEDNQISLTFVCYLELSGSDLVYLMKAELDSKITFRNLAALQLKPFLNSDFGASSAGSLTEGQNMIF